jgi:hypothetical protein
MVTTELLMSGMFLNSTLQGSRTAGLFDLNQCVRHVWSGADTPASKFFINCLAEDAEDVAKFLVPRIRQVTDDCCIRLVLTGPHH